MKKYFKTQKVAQQALGKLTTWLQVMNGG